MLASLSHATPCTCNTNTHQHTRSTSDNRHCSLSTGHNCVPPPRRHLQLLVAPTSHQAHSSARTILSMADLRCSPRLELCESRCAFSIARPVITNAKQEMHTSRARHLPGSRFHGSALIGPMPWMPRFERCLLHPCYRKI